MCRYDASQGPSRLCDEVRRSLAPRNSAHPGVCQRHRRIQVRSRDWAKRKNYRNKSGACCKRIGKQSQSNVTRRKPFSHNPRTYNCSKQQQRAGKLRNYATQESRFHDWPILSISF
jgi:hypothetical protein